jgi:hypothetical protein
MYMSLFTLTNFLHKSRQGRLSHTSVGSQSLIAYILFFITVPGEWPACLLLVEVSNLIVSLAMLISHQVEESAQSSENKE